MSTAATVAAPIEKPTSKEAMPKNGLQNKAEQNEDSRWQPVLGLPCYLTVELPLPNFKVSDFLALRVGSIATTNWTATREVPLRINGTLIGWGEMEAMGKSLAVRVTELA
jgi:flagellar motor switch/type III secretory pathway protein FliN